jgi:hypothetical protein
VDPEKDFSEYFDDSNPSDLQNQEVIEYRTIEYGIWNVLNLPGSIVGSSVGNNNEQSFYINNTDNLYIAKYEKFNLLNLKVINSISNISTQDISEQFLYTTSSIITRGSFLRGYFTFRIKINSGLQSGGYPFIRLQSYINSSLNIIENKYGVWPNSGEIDILEPISYSLSKSGKPQLEWTGKLWFSEFQNPLLQVNNFVNNGNNGHRYKTAVPDRNFKPLKLDKFYDIGIEWRNNKMIWYSNAGMSVTGVPSGKVIGEIDSSQWWSINEEGKLNPKPAPFDTVRSLNIGVATPGFRYYSGNMNPTFDDNSIFSVEYIKIYTGSNVASSSASNKKGDLILGS